MNRNLVAFLVAFLPFLVASLLVLGVGGLLGAVTSPKPATAVQAPQYRPEGNSNIPQIGDALQVITSDGATIIAADRQGVRDEADGSTSGIVAIFYLVPQENNDTKRICNLYHL
jgi:hypothetical protein